MEQLTQKLGKGEIVVREVPLPVLSPGQILVQNYYSLISAGTEGSTVKTARKSLLGKAKERPKQVKQVLNVLRTQGIIQTYRTVMKKLDAYSPLGYSCAGEVIDVGAGVQEFQIGDKVACAGNSASHAEVVSVPSNLAVKLSDDACLKNAAYNTLGAIALQGIRQADLRLGENCAVIGLGLLGQLTCKMLQSSGVNVYGIDVDSAAVQTAKSNCCDSAWQRNEQGVASQIQFLTGGLGVDAVIITAGTSSLDPINFAGEIARKRGCVVVVGAIPTGFDREPHYYRKELGLKMSCSYGPGRYDLNYEEKGLDYPAAYVRWTEKRNMEAFQNLLQSGRIDIGYLTSHVFKLEEAEKAYKMILDRSEPYLGVILEYNTEKEVVREKVLIKECSPNQKIGLAFIGAGSYAQSNLLPNLPTRPSVTRRGVLTNSGITSKRVAEKFKFEFCTSDESDIFNSDAINTIFIATRHDTHASYVLKGINSGKNVFVEKPICLTLDDLIRIQAAYESANVSLMVGFNRRFAPHVRKISENLSDAPLSITYRVNAGEVSGDSWIQDVEIGGGRILGECCHFVDLCTFLCRSLPKCVWASAVENPNRLHDSVSINLKYQNGSIATIQYFSNGGKLQPKEVIEVFQSGMTYQVNDFRSLTEYSSTKSKKSMKMTQNKGQKEMVFQFLKSIENGQSQLISFDEIFSVQAACFGVMESIKTGMPIEVLR